MSRTGSERPDSGGPLVCPNGHAMDEGYFNCPCCGAYRPSAHDPRALIVGGRVVGLKPPTSNEPLGTCVAHGDYWTGYCLRCGW